GRPGRWTGGPRASGRRYRRRARLDSSGREQRVDLCRGVPQALAYRDGALEHGRQLGTEDRVDLGALGDREAVLRGPELLGENLQLRNELDLLGTQVLDHRELAGRDQRELELLGLREPDELERSLLVLRRRGQHDVLSTDHAHRSAGS